jgi:enoyl-CoA hydratase/carnithine racemase
MTYEQIAFERRGRVGLVTLNRPQKLNAWTPRMMAEYRDAIERANADPSIGAIVMTGAGRAFCAGADIDLVFNAQIEGGDRTSGDPSRRPEEYLDFLARMPKPTIAAINGAAVGVGVTQVLPFDLRIASEDARIGFFFVRMGLVPELGSSAFLPRLVGAGRALEWCFTGRMIGASEARDAGLVTEVVAAGPRPRARRGAVGSSARCDRPDQEPAARQRPRARSPRGDPTRGRGAAPGVREPGAPRGREGVPRQARPELRRRPPVPAVMRRSAHPASAGERRRSAAPA